MDGSSGYIVEEEIECTEDWVDTNCTADTITTHINDVDDVGVQSLRNKQADDGEIKLAMILGAVLFILMCVIGCMSTCDRESPSQNETAVDYDPPRLPTSNHEVMRVTVVNTGIAAGQNQMNAPSVAESCLQKKSCLF